MRDSIFIISVSVVTGLVICFMLDLLQKLL